MLLLDITLQLAMYSQPVQETVQLVMQMDAMFAIQDLDLIQMEHVYHAQEIVLHAMEFFQELDKQFVHHHLHVFLDFTYHKVIAHHAQQTAQFVLITQFVEQEISIPLTQQVFAIKDILGMQLNYNA